METVIKLFEEKKVRASWDEDVEEWYFSVIDIIEILTDSVNPRDYMPFRAYRIETDFF